jgi:hypothetical protein
MPGVHEPEPQLSPIVHAFPSSQAAVLFVKTQPAAGSQVSVVQALPSSQGVPLGAAGSSQTPVPGLQVPTPWQVPCAVQVTALPGAQTPD